MQESESRTARRLRLELAIDRDLAGPIRPGHVAVIAQTPYGNISVHHSKFKRYSKKPRAERSIPVVPGKGDPVEWIERESDVDPWENNAKFVAGISYLPESQADRPRNSSQDLVLGACPNLEEVSTELWRSPEIGRLLVETKRNRIAFWYTPEVVCAPRLYPEVIEECTTLMGFSIQQAIAGPRENCEQWITEPAWKWVDLVYREHLNRRNKQVYERHRKETTAVSYNRPK